MSAPGSAHLALVPADTDAPPPPIGAPARPLAVRQIVSPRVRRMVSAIWATGCAGLLTGAFLVPIIGEGGMAMMVLSGLLLVPFGIALGCFALLDRSRETWTALVGAMAVLAAVVGLVAPAQRAAMEMHVAASQAELEAVAVEIRAAAAAAPFDPDPGRGTYAQLGQRFGPRLQPLSVHGPIPVDGGLLFRSSNSRGYTLLYADGVAGPRDDCVDRRLRFLGGHWYAAECRDRPVD